MHFKRYQFTYITCQHRSNPNFPPKQNSISASYIANLLYIGVRFIASTAVHHFIRFNLISVIYEWLQHCTLRYRDSAMVIYHQLLIRVEVHECVVCICRKQFYEETSKSETWTKQIILWPSMLVRINKFLLKQVFDIGTGQSGVQLELGTLKWNSSIKF